MDVTIACICAQPTHETDTVTLADVLDFRATLTVRQEIRFAVSSAREAGEVLSLAEMTAIMTESYLLHAITAWTVKDERGKPLAISKSAIRDRLLANYEEAEKVGDAADTLYSETVVLPLLTGASKSSPPTPTPPKSSTSAPTNGSTPRKRSKPSSISTTPMVVTGPMAASPAGASNSSLS